MALNYKQMSHPRLLRDAVIQPSEDVHSKMAYPMIFGLPGQIPADGGVAEGRCIDVSAAGALDGSILVRNERDLFGAAAEGGGAKPIGSPRDRSDRFAEATRAYSCKQFDGSTSVKLAYIQNSFLMSELEEEYHAKVAAAAVHLKMESFCGDFFQALAAESATAQTTGGWLESDWQNDLNGAALGASNSTLTTLQSALDSFYLSAHGDANAIYMPKSVLQRLQTDPQVLNRSVIGNNAAVTGSGQAVASPDHVYAVLREHMGFEEIVCAGGTQTANDASDTGANSFLWADDRVWIGRAGSVQMQVRNGVSRVISGAGAFCGVYGKLFDIDMGPEAGVGPQWFDVAIDTYFDAVSLQPNRGMIIHNMF